MVIVIRSAAAATFAALLAFFPGPSAASRDGTPLQRALAAGREALAAGKVDEARAQMVRALERDPKLPAAWQLRAEVAAAANDADEQVYALHQRFGLLLAQKRENGASGTNGAKSADLAPLRVELEKVDPIARDLLDLKIAYVARLVPIADGYEKEKRPHAAIRIHQQILALDPEREESRAAIERISAAPDPSLAETAKAKDLFEGISADWMKQFDESHATWEGCGVLTRENYVTKTDAGYAVMVRAGEAMEQMNGFYRDFFQYGTEDDGRKVPRIELHIFKNRDEYLKLGQGPPVEWSGGQFTGGAVETYVGEGGFEETTTTLFHEAAHQFVGLATTAVGWLNEGLASFFEGSRILANGTVLMNMPANHRLFPLAQRMDKGWMSGPDDGIAAGSTQEPERAPTFRIVLENQYPWGPPWYAPTWGVCYLLYNYQDPIDGRFVYRAAFRDFINKSGGRGGAGAVENFEKVVLANPQAPTKGVDFSKADEPLVLPKTAAELDEVWKKWTLALRDEQSGKHFPDRPYLAWARAALTRKDASVAKEHFEKGIVATPNDSELLTEFAKFLSAKKSGIDRAAKLALRAVQALEHATTIDENQLKEAEKLLNTLDPKRRMVARVIDQLEASAKGIAERYLAAGRPMMAMEVAQRLGTDLDLPSLFAIFERAAQSSGRSLALWQLAYNESNFDGWLDTGNAAYKVDAADSTKIDSNFGDPKSGKYDYEFLICDKLTSGDFSFEAELDAQNDVLSFAGLVFGKKASHTFHTLIYYPGRAADPAYHVEARQASVDLTTFYGPSDFNVWRHNAVTATQSTWHKLRLDVVGSNVDVWCDGELVVTQDFGSLDVLRGGFGLITGPGKAQWRNLRFLARSPRDPGAKIEREVTMQRLKDEALRTGKPISSSFVGLEPPFPAEVQWVQEPRESFAEAGQVPQLVLFVSKQQNDSIPIDGWVKEIVEKNGDLGLQAIVIASPDDADFVDYLAKHPFPGSVAFDTRRPGKKSYGTTFEQFFIPRFNLPRVLLLDVDQRVTWEGDPGFDKATPWSPDAPSAVDSPLKELIAKRRLRELKPWLKGWNGGGERQFGEGDLAKVLPLLKQVEAMRGSLDPTVIDVQQKLAILRAALSGVEGTVQQLSHENGEAALPTLLEWATLFEQPVPDEVAKEARRALEKPHAKAFAELVARGKKLEKTVRGKEGLAAARAFAVEVRAGPAPLAPIYADRIEALCAAGDPALVANLLVTAETAIPARWLARSFFRW